jgi:hypothetical protein
MVQSAFASRTHLYERLQSGEPDAMRARLANRFDPTNLAEHVRRFLDERAPAVSPPVGAPAEWLAGCPAPAWATLYVLARASRWGACEPL